MTTCKCGHDLGSHPPDPNRLFAWPCSLCDCALYNETRGTVQRWALQGKLRSEPNGGWLTLRTYRTRKDTQLNKVRLRAEGIGLLAEYRVVLVKENR